MAMQFIKHPYTLKEKPDRKFCDPERINIATIACYGPDQVTSRALVFQLIDGKKIVWSFYSKDDLELAIDNLDSMLAAPMKGFDR